MAVEEAKKDVPALINELQSLVDEPDTDLSTGLSSSDVSLRLEKYGPNALIEEKTSLFVRFLKCFWGPMPAMIWVATIIEAINTDWADMGVLLFLQFGNGIIGFIEEANALSAIDALKDSLAPVAEAKRDGKWASIAASDLVPGDLISLKIGNIIPADCALLQGSPLSVDQAALTGESLPVTKWPFDKCLMGTTIKRGETEALVTSTGSNTFLGRAASLVASVETTGNFQKILFKITLGLLITSVTLVCIIFFYLVFNGKVDPLDATAICVVLLVASIPIAMQVVCTSTMAVGSRQLAAKGAIVARLSAIEELAGMSILCSDKTGTLTKNELVLNEPTLFGDLSSEDLVFWCALACKRSAEGQERDAIDTVICDSVTDTKRLSGFNQTEFVPFNPTDKRTEATVVEPSGLQRRVIKGAPQVVLNMCFNKDEVEERVNACVVDLASRGYRPLGVALSDEDGNLKMQGMLSLFDPPRDDTAETIRLAVEYGVQVKMITGDHTLIAKETARRLNMGTNIHSVEAMEEDASSLNALVMAADGFAEVFPEHKFKIVEVIRSEGFTVGMTGDGVNDAPALKRADIGVAVQGATDAARSAADIVLTNSGLMTIIDALLSSRRIFQRMRNYCIYRVACSMQLLVFFFFAVLTVYPPDYFNDPAITAKAFVLPVTSLVLLTVLNDGTMISIAYDNVNPDKRPQKWNLSEVMFIGTLLGFVAFLGSILFFFAGVYSARGQNGFFSTILGTHTDETGSYITYGELLTCIYLKVSISDFLTVLSARCTGHAFSRKPGKLLLGAFLFATTAASFLAAYWPFSSNNPDDMQPISWKLVGIIWAWNIIVWIVQDLTKMLAYWVVDARKGLAKSVSAAANAIVSQSHSRGITFLAALLLFSDSILTTAIAPIYPTFLSGLGYGAKAIGIVFAAKPFLTYLTEPLAKSMSDAFGPAIPLFSGTFLQIIATSFMGSSDKFWPILVGRALQGVASGMYVYSVLNVLSATHSTHQRSGLMRFAMQGIGMGTVAGPLLAGGVYTAVGHSGPDGAGPAITFNIVAGLLGICFVMETYLVINNIIPWCRHITPPDAQMVTTDTERMAHEATVLLPSDWAGQRRGPVGEKMQVARNGAYRRYDPLEVAEFDAAVESQSHYVKASASTTLLGGLACEGAQSKNGALTKYSAERQISRHASRSSSFASLANNPLDKEGRSESGVFQRFNDISEPAAAGEEGTEPQGEARLVVSWFLVMISSLVVGAVEPVVPYYLYHKFNSNPLNQAFVLLCLFISYQWASPASVRVSDRLGRPGVLLSGLASMGLGLALVRVDSIFSLAALGLVLVGFGAACVDAPAALFMNEEAAKSGKDAYDVFFTQNTATMVGLTLGPLACSFMSNNDQSYVTFFAVAAACVGIVFFVFCITLSCSRKA